MGSSWLKATEYVGDGADTAAQVFDFSSLQRDSKMGWCQGMSTDFRVRQTWP